MYHFPRILHQSSLHPYKLSCALDKNQNIESDQFVEHHESDQSKTILGVRDSFSRSLHSLFVFVWSNNNDSLVYHVHAIYTYIHTHYTYICVLLFCDYFIFVLWFPGMFQGPSLYLIERDWNVYEDDCHMISR